MTHSTLYSTLHYYTHVLHYHCTRTAVAVKGVFTAQVYTRSLLARLLGLPCEQLLIEWGITLGNDYTAQFDSIPGKCNQPESMLAYVKHQGQGYKVLDGGNTELAQALQFTRLLYEVRTTANIIMILAMKKQF
jgi:hypothetical protein